jgi:Flp pilus assembly pilin Flp
MLNQIRGSGQGLLEYALVIALVSVVIIAVLMALGVGLNDLFGTLGAYIPFGN